MIKINIKTLETTRDPIQKNIIGLKPETLRNLQTELDPVPIDLIDIEFWPENNIPVEYNQYTHKIEEEILTADVENKQIDVESIVVPLSVSELEALKQIKITELAALRFEKETAGITVNGATIRTDLESQSKITGSWCTVQINPNALIDFKGENGWVQINAATTITIAAAVSNHVQACYSNERRLSDLIKADVETDITTGWPE